MDEATYERFDTSTGFQATIERLLAQPGRELRIFDPDASSLRLNDPARIAQLDAFLGASRTRRIYMVIHQTDHLLRQCPRFLGLLARFSHAVQINRTRWRVRTTVEQTTWRAGSPARAPMNLTATFPKSVSRKRKITSTG